MKPVVVMPAEDLEVGNVEFYRDPLRIHRSRSQGHQISPSGTTRGGV